jgi:hypothetical protein
VNDRSVERSHVDALIVEAQRFADQLFVETDRATDLINNLLWLIQRAGATRAAKACRR